MSSTIVFGLWPLAGITTIGVTDSDAIATMVAVIEGGITSFDTAFGYGYDGESDKLLGQFVASDRDRFTIIGKVGQRWSADHQRVIDGRPETLVADTETSLRRIGIEQFDLLMLHSPDPKVSIESSARAMESLVRRGLAQRVGVCNVDDDQLRAFSGATTCTAIQCPLNLLQPDSLDTMIPTASDLGYEVYAYWALMKGLLAGQIGPDHVFPPGDSRSGYDVFQGESRRRAHRIVDELAKIAASTGKTIAQLSIGWAVSQPGVTAALVGARRADQAKEIAGATRLTIDVLAQIDQARLA